MTVTVTDDRRDDIEDALSEAAVLVRMARAAADVAEQETSERDVRYTLIAIRNYLDQIDGVHREMEGLIAEALAAPEQGAAKVETPKGPATRDARTGRGTRGRRGE